MARRFLPFLQSESGAVTVDWVVLTAATVGLGLTSAAAVGGGLGALGDDIEGSLTVAAVADLAYDSGRFDPIHMPGMTYWQNHTDAMHGHWLQYGGDLTGWTSLHDPTYRMDIMAAAQHPWMVDALGPDGHALDLIGEPGQHLSIEQPHALAAGQSATVRFQAANAFNGAMNVYWGNQLIGTFESVPVNQFQTYTIPVTGGAGDGSNRLRFESTAGDGWRGVYLANVEVN